jgi:hypothetical protein
MTDVHRWGIFASELDMVDRNSICVAGDNEFRMEAGFLQQKRRDAEI